MAHRWLPHLERGLNTAARTITAAHSAYQIGKAIYGLARAAPYAAAGAALLL
jgi:hypothetical protein